MVLFEIQGLGENMKSFVNHNAEGFLGLASNSKGIDFMQTLMDNGQITHKIFSTFIDPSGKSFIKFGGYDDSGIASGY